MFNAFFKCIVINMNQPRIINVIRIQIEENVYKYMF